MKRVRWIALVLAVAMLFTGCSGLSFEQLWESAGLYAATPFDQMQYTRPDMSEMQEALEVCCTSAESGSGKRVLMDEIWEFYRLYNTFNTQYNLASIYYFQDMTDSHWEEEYSFCAQNAASAEAMLEELFYTLAACPLKDELEADPAFGEGFFDSYTGESIWDETFLGLMEQEAALEEKYYDLCTQAQDAQYYSDEYFEVYGKQMGQVFVDLVALRQDIAQYAGYDDYASFAYEFYHYRSYTPQQAQTYLQEIQQQLVPLYREVEQWGGASNAGDLCTQKAAFGYVENTAEKMGGTVGKAFSMMESAGLYDITHSEKKFDGSFEVYLTDYNAPFVFVNPSATQQDKLTFLHEFGHFCNDYASAGSVVGVDVAEVFSQGLEYLSLHYADDGEKLEEMKMVDSLRIFVEQAAYALFEQKAYQLEGAELTAENVYALYDQIGSDFGFDVWGWDSRDFVMIGHFFTDPMYIISYVVSNDAALQLYQMEEKDPGSGLELYQKELSTEQTCFLAFLEEAGLESPFAPGRLTSVKATLTEILG